MSFSQFLNMIIGFLFFPSRTMDKISNQGNISTNYSSYRRVSYFFMAYFCLSIGFVLWFLISYPEPLYYGVSGDKFKADMPTQLIGNPFLNLIICLTLSFLCFLIFMHLIIGSISYKIITKSGGKPRDSRSEANSERKLKEYLLLFSFSFIPLLLIIPFCTTWLYFFEKITFSKPIFPFFDLTLMNGIFLSFICIFLAWKYLIEYKINQSFFQISRGKALTSVVIQFIILLGIGFLFFFLTTLFEQELIGGLII